MVFHGSRLTFSWFQVDFSGFLGRFSWFFMVLGRFSWFFIVPDWFFMVPVGFNGVSWFQVGFSFSY